MIEIHNKSTYQRIYNEFSTMFIDAYCEFRRTGHSTKDSLAAAKISIQCHVAEQVISSSPNKKTTLKAYTNLKDDTQLIQKAIQYYQGMES